MTTNIYLESKYKCIEKFNSWLWSTIVQHTWYVTMLIDRYLSLLLKNIIAHCCRLVDIGKAMGCKVKMDKSQEVPSIVIQLVAPLKFQKPLTGARPKARRWQEIRLLMDDKRTRVVYSVTDLFGSKQFIGQKEFLYRACTL